MKDTLSKWQTRFSNKVAERKIWIRLTMQFSVIYDY